MAGKVKDLTGQPFGHFIVLRLSHVREGGRGSLSDLDARLYEASQAYQVWRRYAA